jgi:hypothetical protein
MVVRGQLSLSNTFRTNFLNFATDVRVYEGIRGMQSNSRHVGFEVLNAVVMNNSVFPDITPCSPLKVDLRFGGICRHHLQG